MLTQIGEFRPAVSTSLRMRRHRGSEGICGGLIDPVPAPQTPTPGWPMGQLRPRTQTPTLSSGDARTLTTTAGPTTSRAADRCTARLDSVAGPSRRPASPATHPTLTVVDSMPTSRRAPLTLVRLFCTACGSLAAAPSSGPGTLMCARGAPRLCGAGRPVRPGRRAWAASSVVGRPSPVNGLGGANATCSRPWPARSAVSEKLLRRRPSLCRGALPVTSSTSRSHPRRAASCGTGP